MQSTRLTFLLNIILMVFILSACQQTDGQAQGHATNIIQEHGATPALVASGNFKEYALPQERSGVMRPVMDRRGRLWFGEMGQNTLTMFDPHSAKFQQLQPPNGKAGIMGTVVAADDSIWFAEQSANYIGRYDPGTRQFQSYSLPIISIPDALDAQKTQQLPSAPNGLSFDPQGNLWFTEMNADSIGMLNMQTKRITHYPLSPQKTRQSYNPYGITIDRQGIVWFTLASNNNLARLDPKTGTIRFFTLPGPRNPLMEIVSDEQGTLWATTFMDSTLVRFTPTNGKFTTFLAPKTGAGSGGMYGITITPHKELWVTIPAANTVARFDIQKSQFVYYTLPTPRSSPLGIIGAPDKSIWFTAALSSQVVQLRV